MIDGRASASTHRAGDYTDSLFQKLTGKELTALWTEFASAERARAQ
ncbi:MAG TPA: hypothetical protein VK689_17505 [Armatimonadota bacterium]|nr:hypothetical protein [Armatimonadota bacterium]